jgi:transposase
MRFSSLQQAIADRDYQGKMTADEMMTTAFPSRSSSSDTAKGFHVLPKRWIVERNLRLAWSLPPTGERL